MAEEEAQGTFVTIASDGEGRYTEKMSRFLAFAFRVGTQEEARVIIKRLSNEYHDARHVCWAYMLGYRRDEWQVNDNGEPSGTAGKPILGQINSLGLTDVLVVVVRYFGGIKLGTPGLIVAYREAARRALEAAGRLEVTRCRTLSFSVGYENLDRVMRIIKERNLAILAQEIGTECVMEIDVPVAVYSEIESRLGNIERLEFRK